MSALTEALLFRAGYNSSVVTIGAAFLGAAGGLIGCFLLLRRRAMLSDALSHATLPGLVLAFLAGAAFLGDGRVLAVLLGGAAASAALGGLAVHGIARNGRLAEDTAIASVLATFYGAGIVLLSRVQSLPVGGQAGLERFLLGSGAGMLRHEAELVALLAAALVVVTVLLLKELRLLCFDPAFGEAHGWPSARLDLLLLGLLLAHLVIGLQIVGLVLAIAVVIVPAATARLWTERLASMLVLAVAVGGLGGYLGAALSAALPRLPTGATIVLVLVVLFLASLLLAPGRGVLAVALRRAALRRRLAAEAAGAPGTVP